MKWQAEAAQRADEWEIRRLAPLYARAMDSNVPDILDRVFTEDGVIDRQGVLRDGLAVIRAIPGELAKRYKRTVHKVHQQLITVTGPDSAEGEVYCTAEHLERDRGGGFSMFTMSIRYQDQYVKQGGLWKFKRRTLVIDWTDMRQVVSESVKG